jgi:hypothetical protein
VVRKIMLSSAPLFFLFFLFTDNGEAVKNIELFHIGKNKIVKTIPTNPTIQSEAEKILKTADSVVKKLNPIPDQGYMIRIPLEPPVQLENKWINALIDEVILIIPEEEKPHILIFDDENNMYFFTFQRKMDTIIKALDIPPLL